MKNDFNILITGTGGQGLITLMKVLSSAALSEKKDLKSSELHGLSQRGGSTEIHLRFGKNIFSPITPYGKADLVLALEIQEALKAGYYANKETKILINDHRVPTMKKDISEKKIKKELKKITKNFEIIPASKKCKEELDNEVVSSLFLTGVASEKGILSLRNSSVEKGIEKAIPEKYVKINKKAFSLGKRSV